MTREAGLSSPSRLHDLFITFEAITLGEYKTGGAGLQITYGFHETPFGTCLLATTERGICGLHFVSPDTPKTLKPLIKQWPQAQFVQKNGETQT